MPAEHQKPAGQMVSKARMGACRVCVLKGATGTGDEGRGERGGDFCLPLCFYCSHFKKKSVKQTFWSETNKYFSFKAVIKVGIIFFFFFNDGGWQQRVKRDLIGEVALSRQQRHCRALGTVSVSSTAGQCRGRGGALGTVLRGVTARHLVGQRGAQRTKEA